MDQEKKPLFIYEMANNHQGDVEHGIRIIHELKRVSEKYMSCFRFGIKFQYRNLDTFIRPDYLNRDDIKNVKRFKDTRLTKSEFLKLKKEAELAGFLTICTPFDESSVDLIMEHEYDIIKIASCSFNDWPLLEKIAQQKKPIIASAAGSGLEEIHKVLFFFRHRGIPVSLMHCVAEYPTDNQYLQMNQIDLLHKEFPDYTIGFSTHESPDNLFPIRIAIAKGAEIFEKHVGVPTEKIVLNGYSANPEQIEAWLQAAYETYEMCGIKEQRYESNQKEKDDLAALQRGVFLREEVKNGQKISEEQVYFAFPCEKDQLLSRDFSKYSEIFLKKDMDKNAAIFLEDVEINNNKQRVEEIVVKVMEMIRDSHVVIPIDSKCSLSHHYGLGLYEKTGVAIVDCINREYCKKILVLLPGQNHPLHLHKQKEETFSILYGDITVNLDGTSKKLHAGETQVVERGVNHSFSTENGCVFEEISTTHYVNDSYYEEKDKFVTPRKTNVFITKDMIDQMKI